MLSWGESSHTNLTHLQTAAEHREIWRNKNNIAFISCSWFLSTTDESHNAGWKLWHFYSFKTIYAPWQSGDVCWCHSFLPNLTTFMVTELQLLFTTFIYLLVEYSVSAVLSGIPMQQINFTYIFVTIDSCDICKKHISWNIFKLHWPYFYYPILKLARLSFNCDAEVLNGLWRLGIIIILKFVFLMLHWRNGSDALQTCK